MTNQLLSRYVMIGFGILSMMPNSARAYTVEQILSQLKLKEENLKSVQFDFKQEIGFSTTGQKSETEGQALFEKPNKLSVMQTKPQAQITITNGKKTWIYTPDYRQVWVGNKGKNFSELLPKGMIPFQNVAEELRTNYDLTVKVSSSGVSDEVHLGAIPKDKEGGYELELVFSTDSWLPKKTIYVSSTAKVVTTILGYQMNPVMKEKAFEFTPPPGTDVIPF